MDITLEKLPPESGGIEFIIDRSPVSIQSMSKEKHEIKDHISSIVKSAEFLLSGDVKIYISWYVHEEKRYETDASADVDNIIKPLLDALCGPTGILIDDNQVQQVQCSWIDSYVRDKERVGIRIEYIPDEYLPKEGLAFVNIKKNLCLPFCRNHTPESLSILISAYEQQFTCRKELSKQGWDYYKSSSVMSIQRVFHKSRLKNFEVIELDDFKKTISFS